MITILVDDRKFTLSDQTLKNNPDFIISQMMHNSSIVDPFIERVNETTFIIDTSPDAFKLIIDELRSANSDIRSRLIKKTTVDESNLKHTIGGSNLKHIDEKNNNISSIFQKSKLNGGSSNITKNDSAFFDFTLGSDLPSNIPLTMRSNTQSNISNLVNQNSINSTNKIDLLSSSEMSTNSDILINLSKNISKNTPKRQHVYRSRKIELNTSEDNNLI